MKMELVGPNYKIVREGCKVESMFVIRSGNCLAYKGKSKKENNANLLQTGDYFGETGVLLPSSLSNKTVIALDWCELCIIYRDILVELLEYYPTDQIALQQYTQEKLVTLHKNDPIIIKKQQHTENSELQELLEEVQGPTIAKKGDSLNDRLSNLEDRISTITSLISKRKSLRA